MRFLFAFSVLIFLTSALSAQKHDYMWPLGYNPETSAFRFFYNFNTDTPSVSLRTDTYSTGLYSASYCDKNGQLMFFSNGLKIFDKNGAIVENGEGLNPTVVEWQTQLSYPGGQTGFFLENPSNASILYFISLDFGEHPAGQWPYVFVGKNVVVATIDITANNGAGKVLEKNRVLLTGTLMSPAACRHANGRDWWILTSNADENQHYRILLTPSGFSAPQTQAIGSKPSPLLIGNNLVGNCFSPQGQYYVDAHEQLGFSIFQFDRCSGLLSQEKRYDYPAPDPQTPNFRRYSYGSGAVFSPDEKLFYKTTKYNPAAAEWAVVGNIPYLFQFDLTAPDLAASIDTINTINPLEYYPYALNLDGFYGAELGPDGRIYIVHQANSYCSVQYPNIRGKGCKFIHDKPFFDVQKGAAIPYMPNYRLGSLDGSACDTLGLNNIPVANFRVDDTLTMLSRYFYDLSHHEPANWHWNFGDGNTSTEQSPLHHFATPSIYQVCLTVSNTNGSDTQCRTLYIGVSATTSPENSVAVSITPNPFSGHIHVETAENFKHSFMVLFDQTGRQVLTADIMGDTNIDTHALPAGVYFWKIFGTNGQSLKGKVLKSN